MRILVVMNLYPPHAYGGYEDLCAGAVGAWREAGHDVAVLCSDWRRPDVPDDAAPPAGEPVARALPIYWDDHRLVTPSVPGRLLRERRTRRVVERALDRLNPDVVSVWNPGALSFGLFTYLERSGVPVTLVVLDRWLRSAPALDPWRSLFDQGAGRRLAPLVGAVTGLSTTVPRLGRRVVACFASRFLRSDAPRRFEVDRRAVAPHGVDLERYPPAGDEPSRPWDGRLLFVGRLAREKGVGTALEALALLPRAALRLLGTGERAERRRLRRRVAELGIEDRVIFGGEAGPGRLRRAYRDADAVVFPSRWQEPFGIVPLEAMASGAPVVATGTGGSGEFLVDGLTALRFAPDDPDGLAGAVRRLRDDDALRGRLRSNGLAVARWLSRSRSHTHLMAWHRHAAAPAATPPPGDRLLLPPALRAPVRGEGARGTGGASRPRDGVG